MVFGEIVEPSTRALIDDEYEEYPEYTELELVWEPDLKLPAKLNSVIFVESPKIKKLFESFVLSSNQIYCQLRSGDINVYKSSNDQYIIVFNPKNLATGQVTEVFEEWLRKSVHVYAITSQSISVYQNSSMLDKPETLIRKLTTTNTNDPNYKQLESPNLVSGLGADIVSFCMHQGLKASIFVVYMDNSPLDSINTKPVIELLQSLELPVKFNSVNLNAPSSNLYL